MPDGRVMHAEVRIDDSVVMLAEGGDAWPAFPAGLHVYVRDVVGFGPAPGMASLPTGSTLTIFSE
jgi:uncharacterized glyoxalase superfamily protein PhnB